MSISGVFGRNNLTKLVVDVELPEEVYAGKKVPLRITLRNPRKRMPSFLIRVKSGESTAFFPFLDAGAEATKYVETAFDRRGEFSMPDVELSSVFPFNFFIRYRHLHRGERYVVFPGLQKHRAIEGNDGKERRQGARTSDRTGFESDIISIRQYTEGDPLKYINWKATAKTGELKTKELSSPAARPVVVDFDKVAIRDIEERISSVAYTLLQLLKEDVPVGLRLRDKLYAPDNSRGHKIAMLTGLALYDQRS